MLYIYIYKYIFNDKCVFKIGTFIYTCTYMLHTYVLTVSARATPRQLARRRQPICSAFRGAEAGQAPAADVDDHGHPFDCNGWAPC